MSSNNSNGSRSLWKDNANVYPPGDEIALALQDRGSAQLVKRKGGDIRTTKFPLIQKLANKIYSLIQKELNPDGLTKNVTRGSKPLFKEILLSRRHVDIANADPFFHPYGKDGKVFLVTNEPRHSGIDVCIARFEEYVIQQTHQKNTARTNNDGLRLGLILLDSTYRGSVSGIMSKKKDRKKSDITGDPTTHFFEEVLTECFLNPQYVLSLPPDVYYSEFPEEEKGNWDPNHPSIFEHERSGVWLRSTWEEYLRPKYKKALDKWNKDTGGGDGSPVSFIDFCGGDRWLVWLFCVDYDSNFLLACSAGGRMPKHLQIESGFTEDVSSLGEGDSSGKRSAYEDEFVESKKQRQKLTDTIDRVAGYLEAKQEDAREDLNQVAKYSQMMTDESVLDTMSPDSKDVYLSTLKKKRKDLLTKMNEE